MLFRGMSAALCVLVGGTASAQIPEARGAPLGNRTSQPHAMSDYLKVEFRDLHTLKITRNGEDVGPTLFSILPSEVVRGSIEAQRHAYHAMVFQGFVIGLSITGIGLIYTGLRVRQANDHNWTNASTYLVGGGIGAFFLAAACALLKQNELFHAVNSYNYDLVTGNLSQ